MICSYCSANMPDISAFCPECGRAVQNGDQHAPVPAVDPLSGAALLGAVSYLTPVPAALFLAIPALRRDPFVRFHALQSVLFAIVTLCVAGLTRLLFALLSLLGSIGFLLAWLAVGLVSLAMVFLWVVLILKPAMGGAYELPWVGPLAERLSDRL
jgi:uncharacterized membrane protein